MKGISDIFNPNQQGKKEKDASKHLDEITVNPMKTQEELLMKILKDNKDTEYGKKYGFEKIHSIEEFRSSLPLTKYDDYSEYIKRMTEKGEKNLITSYNIAIYNKSSGTVGTPKRIPMTNFGVEKFVLYSAEYENIVLSKKFGNSLNTGRTINLVQCNENLPVMKDGNIYGALSESILLKIKPFWTRLFTSPVEASFAGPGVNAKYLHARYALSDDKVTKLTCSFASFAMDFFRYIEKNWKLLVEDIEKGTIDNSIKLPDEDRKNLIKNLKPNPNRAKELRKIFEQGFDTPFAPKVWPNLKLISCAATGTFKEYAARLQKRYLGKISFYRRGVGASEGFLSVATELDSCNSSLIPDSVFYEFLPEDKEAVSGNLVTLDKLEVGKRYKLFITNLSGFYRYYMGDVFEVKGFYNKTPTVEFLYRADKTVSLMGEKTSEVALLTAAQSTSSECGFHLVGSTVYPDIDNSRYIFLIEADSLPKNFDLKKARDILEKELAKDNPSMGDKVKKGLLSPTVLKLLKEGTFKLYKENLQMKGYPASQIKPVTVISNEVQRKFFFDSIEKE